MIQIGAPLAADFTNPLGVLSDCHRRVERFLQLLITVSEHAQGGPLSAEQRDALRLALRYFREAAPMHTADEEESLFPRLRRAAHPRVAVVLRAVENLEGEHEAARFDHLTVDLLGRRWLANDSLPAERVHELRDALRRLETLYERHIAIEDREVFPLSRLILNSADIATMGQEMTRRRGLESAALPVRSTAAGGCVMPGPVYRYLSEDHARLDALLNRILAISGEIDRIAEAEFRAGLLKHISMEEKILLLDAQRRRGGEPLPVAAKLRADHGAIAALLVPTPTPQTVAALRSILAGHNAIEEGPGGMYETCEQLAGAEVDDLHARLRAAPEVPAAAHVDGPNILAATRRALLRAGFEKEANSLTTEWEESA